MQSLIPASYPLLKEKHALSFIQIGLISLTFQISGALLQPVFGLITDRKAAPYLPVIGMAFTFSGLISLAFAQNYQIIFISAVLIGIGSSIFHILKNTYGLEHMPQETVKDLLKVFFKLGVKLVVH